MSMMVGIKYPLTFSVGNSFVAPSGVSTSYQDANTLVVGGVPMKIDYTTTDADGITFYVEAYISVNQGN